MSSIKYYVCCPMCDKDKCVRGAEECDAVKWEKEKIVGEKWRKEKEGDQNASTG